MSRKGLHRDNRMAHGNYYYVNLVYWGYMGIMEKEHEKYHIVYRGCIRIMEKKMESTFKYFGVIYSSVRDLTYCFHILKRGPRP